MNFIGCPASAGGGGGPATGRDAGEPVPARPAQPCAGGAGGVIGVGGAIGAAEMHRRRRLERLVYQSPACRRGRCLD